MAPTVPKKRPSMRAKAVKSSSVVHAAPAIGTSAISSNSLFSSKKDKRLIKHSSFVNRIEKSRAKPLKRRRPNKKLVTTLEGLADALPDVADLANIKSSSREGDAKVRRSLKSRPGAMKRKEKLERVERERFSKNLASILNVPKDVTSASGIDIQAEAENQSTAVSSKATAVPPASGGRRFAALRAWVKTNMEQHSAFEKGS